MPSGVCAANDDYVPLYDYKGVPELDGWPVYVEIHTAIRPGVFVQGVHCKQLFVPMPER
jgi:hypothetical protein